MARRTLILCGLAVLMAIGRAGATCGDGVVDGFEMCDDGPANGTDGCCSATCQRVDFDGDGVCDAEDSCAVNSIGLFMKEPRITVDRLDDPLGEQAFRFTGTLVTRPDPPIDPAVNGLRLSLRYFFGADVFDATAPGGTGWITRGGGTAWTYRARSSSPLGITRVALKQVPLPAGTAFSPGFAAFAFVVQGRGARYAFAPQEHLVATISLDAGVLDGLECSDAFFGPSVPWHCAAGLSGTRVSCGARRVGPCHVSDPDDMMVCDALDAAAAESRYREAHGAFFAGDCADLPGFVPSPSVVCSAAPIGTTGFTVGTSSPFGRWRSCVWISDPGPLSTNLTCS